MSLQEKWQRMGRGMGEYGRWRWRDQGSCHSSGGRGSSLAAVLAAGVMLGAWLGYAPPTRAVGPSISGQTVISVRIAPSIEVDMWPSPLISLAAAIPQRPVVSSALTLRVRANAAWGVQLSTDHPGGLLRPWNGSCYVPDGKPLSLPLEWGTSPAGPWTPFTGTAAAWLTNQPATGDQPAERTFYVRFTPTFADMAGETEYRVGVTMAAGVGY